MQFGTRERADDGAATEDQSLAWFAEECHRNHVPVEGLVRMAERARDRELAAFFRRALDVSDRFPRAA
jgi:hypothetical protein